MKREDTFPFWIMTLREYYIWLIDNNGEQTPELRLYKKSLNPGKSDTGTCNSFYNSDWAQRYGNGGFHFTNIVIEDSRKEWYETSKTWYYPSYDNYTVRILPPMGWLTLSDMFISARIDREGYKKDIAYRRYTHTDGNTYDIGPRDIFEREIVFVKKDPIYAIPCDGLFPVQYQTNSGIKYIFDNGSDGSPCSSEFGVRPTDLGNNVVLNAKTKQKDTWVRERAICYKLTCSNQSYIAPGSRWGNYWGHTLELYGAVNRVYLETVSYRPEVKKLYETKYWDGGAQLANSDGTEPGCKYTAWSTVAYYNRDGKKNGNILDEKADSTIEPGVLRYTSVFMASWGEYPNEWDQNFDGDGAARVLYLLHFENTNRLCCVKPDLGAGECGFGTNAITPNSTQCADLYRKMCRFDSPYFTTNYCLKNGCRKDVQDNTNLIVCDYEFKKFCNYIEDPAIPNSEKAKLLEDKKPYGDIANDCNLYDEAFPDWKYTTDKRKMWEDMCNNTPYKQVDSDTGKIYFYDNDTANIMQYGFRGEPGYRHPLKIEWDQYCAVGGKYYLAFQRWYSSKPNCADAKLIAGEFDSRISKVDQRLSDIQKSNAIGKSINQLKYPDICSCYASTKTLKEDCNNMADILNIRNNKPAKKVLNIDTDDPLQCTQNCAVNTLCRQQTVPSAQGYPADRVGRYVQHGYIQDKGTCEDKNLCVQTATVNAEGKIGSLTINQTANCGSYKSKFCLNSVLSKCDTQNGRGLFVKRVLEDKDGGTCTGNLESLQCANINLVPIIDTKCNSEGFRTLVYSQTKDNVNKDDVIDALTTLLTPEMKLLDPKISYDPVNKRGTIVTKCQNCELGYENKSACYLDTDKKWKVKATKTKVIKEPVNGGSSCAIDNSVQVAECNTDIDCSVSLKSGDTGCLNDERKIEYNIDSFNSGNGKSCNDVILSKLPSLFKENAPTINISDQTATASIDCRDCVVGYKVDPSFNNGKCFFDGTRNIIKKFPFIKKLALNGGSCNVNLNSTIVEECKIDQDCVFNEEPTEETDCIDGQKTYEFDVKIPQSGNGKSCNEVGKTFGSKYNPIDKDIINNKIYIKSTCDKPQDCEIDTKPYQSGCDLTTGKGVEIYEILTPQKNGGKTCAEVYGAKLFYGRNIVENRDTITVEKECLGVQTLAGTIKSNKQYLYFVILGIILILYVMIIKIF